MNSKIKYTNNPLHKNNNNYNNYNNHSTDNNFNNYIVDDFYEEMTDPIETNKKWFFCNFFTCCF